MTHDCNLDFINKLNHISEVIIFDDVATIDFDNENEEDQSYGYSNLSEANLKVDKYKLEPSGVVAVLNALKNCDTINFNNYSKTMNFITKNNLTADDCLEIIHNIKPEDYYANTRSFTQNFGGNNLIIFETKPMTLSSEKNLSGIVLYIKIDLDDTTDKAVALVSMHDCKQNNLPYIKSDFVGLVEDYYEYDKADDLIYDFLLDLLEDEK